MMYLTIKDVSTMLQIKPSTLYAWVGQRKIPFVKIHGCIRFLSEDLEQWIGTFRTETQPETSTACLTPSGRGDLDAIIASAKHAVYTPSHGKPDEDRATRKGDSHGSV